MARRNPLAAKDEGSPERDPARPRPAPLGG